MASVTWLAIYSTLMFVPFAIWDTRHTALAEIPAEAWLIIAWFALFLSIIGILLWMFGLRTISSSVAGAFAGVMPVSALVISAIFLDESIGWPHILGLILVVAGIVMVVQSRRQQMETGMHTIVKTQTPTPTR